MAWEGQDPGQRQTALQVAERRFVRGVPRPVGGGTPLRGLHTFEWRIAWGMYAREWASLGASVDWSWAPGVTGVEQKAVQDSGLPLPHQGHEGETAVWSSSFTQDMTGR